MAWYAVRTVYHFGVKPDQTNVFEERVLCFEAESFEQAHEKAAAEAEIYAEENGFEAHSEQVAYKQDGEQLIDGYEVWSELFESKVDLASFWANRYEQYQYHPEE